MNIYRDDNLYPFIKGFMLGDKRVVKVIKSCGYEDIWSQDHRRKVPTPVLGFEGTGKKLILSRTNIDRIAYLYGPETNDWVGKKIELYAEAVRVAGKDQLPIRVSLERPKEEIAPKPAKADKLFDPIEETDGLNFEDVN